MISEYIRYQVDAASQDDFMAAYERARAPLLSSPFALAFDMWRCVEDPGAFILRVDWTSAEDHMRGFRGSDAFRAFFAEVRPFVASIAEMRHYEPLWTSPATSPG